MQWARTRFQERLKEREPLVGIDVVVPVLVPGLRSVRPALWVVPALVVDEVGWVSCEKRCLLPSHQAGDVLGVRGVTTQQSVPFENPQVARSTHWNGRWLAWSRILQIACATPLDLVEQRVDLRIVEANAKQGIFCLHLSQELAERIVVPRCQFGGTVEGDTESSGLEVTHRTARRRRIPSQPSSLIATSLPLPPMTRPVPWWTTSGSA